MSSAQFDQLREFAKKIINYSLHYLKRHIILKILHEVQHFLSHRKSGGLLRVILQINFLVLLSSYPNAAELSLHVLAEEEVSENHLVAIDSSLIEN